MTIDGILKFMYTPEGALITTCLLIGFVCGLIAGAILAGRGNE